MTPDEALELVEIVLDYQRLNKVQELVFRQSWEGQSYVEIAKNTGYEPDYIKDAGAKLWKLLSEAFGEKVKKDNIQSVLRRYLQQNKVNVQRNLTIEVNLSGANLSGANLNGARVVANFIETDSSKAISPNKVMPDNHIQTGRETLEDEEQIYHWNGLDFCSEAQVKIAEALDRTNILFIPNFKIRLTSTEGRENKQVDFLIFYQGKSGILEIDRPPSQQDEANFRECDQIFQTHGISIIQYYNPSRCSEEPDRVVQEFLETLSKVED
ncbi:pentapeptide repeat-containing protein [Floridanema aerugineum]|uniref:Pentapeptide repeat-containing protein n=1 Tax=Floridaenema aerugineum BLCC-F46 TaxID=3153654 RepID=A0ABV4X712_9CYAN